MRIHSEEAGQGAASRCTQVRRPNLRHSMYRTVHTDCLAITKIISRHFKHIRGAKDKWVKVTACSSFFFLSKMVSFHLNASIKSRQKLPSGVPIGHPVGVRRVKHCNTPLCGNPVHTRRMKSPATDQNQKHSPAGSSLQTFSGAKRCESARCKCSKLDGSENSLGM